MLKIINLKKDRQRWRDYFCLFISFLFLVFFYINRAPILENAPGINPKYKIALLAFLWLLGAVLIFVRLDFGKNGTEY